MNTYKYIILFIVLTICNSKFVNGQYHIGVEVNGIVPITNNAKGHKMGIEAALPASLTLNKIHEISIVPSYFRVPGEKADDKYLSYEHSSVSGFPIQVGYAHKITRNLSPSLIMGPLFFTQPDTVTGFMGSLGLKYQWNRVDIHLGLQRIMHHGHLDLFRFGLGYRLF